MPSRRTILKTLGAATAGFTGITPLLQGCAASVATYMATARSGMLSIPKADVPALENPNTVVNVRATNLSESIIIRNVEGHGIVALSSTCTHRSCEVRTMPGSHECPCHGSKYNELGEVVNGPASRPLTRFEVEETGLAIRIRLSQKWRGEENE